MKVFFPNIIKYNNTDNNIFYPSGAAATIEKVDYLFICDRWGNRIYNKENFKINDSSDGWDGTLNGTKLVNGVYTFMAQFTTTKGDKFKYVGDVTLID
jgi:gliding motility-associated-like protein